MSYKRHLFFGNLFFIANIVLVLIVFGFAYYLFHLQNTTFQGEGELYPAEPYRAANLQIDVSKVTTKISPLWASFAQGGEEQSTNMLAGTETLMRQLGPRYVRLDHIFDDDYYGVVKGSGSDLSLDWSKLDATVESILQMGAKPFFSLGYMPSALAASKIDMPYDWGRWQWLVEKCIEHYSGTKGIADVYYEVWNEPDLESFGKWHYSGSKNYLTLYRYSALAAQAVRHKQTAKRFYFGGPAITASYQNWIQALVTYAQTHNLPVDFVSWHRYSYDENRYREDVISLRSWLVSKGTFGVVISEFGPDSEKTGIYSSSVAGAHAVAVSRQLLESGLDYLMAFEIKDGPNQGSMGWGLLTHNEASIKPKPRYKAYTFMRSMSGDRLLVQGEGSNVTAWANRRGDEVSVIVSNYDQRGSQTEQVPIEFIRMIPGEYVLVWDKLTGKGGEERVAVTSQGSFQRSYTLKYGDVLKMRLKPLK